MLQLHGLQSTSSTILGPSVAPTQIGGGSSAVCAYRNLKDSERFWKVIKGYQRISKVHLRNLGAALVQNRRCLSLDMFGLWPFVAQWSRTCARQLPVVEVELAELRLEADNSLARRSEISQSHFCMFHSILISLKVESWLVGSGSHGAMHCIRFWAHWHAVEKREIP